MSIKRINELRAMIITVLQKNGLTLEEAAKCCGLSRRQAFNIRKLARQEKQANA